MQYQTKCFIIYAALLFAGPPPSSPILVWYGAQGDNVTLPCGSEASSETRCVWGVPVDDSGACSGQQWVMMSSIISGEYPGLAWAGKERPCDLWLWELTLGHEGLYTCKGSVHQLLVKGASTPALFVDGRQMDNGALLTTLTTTDHTLQCSVQWSRPAASIRWVVGEYDHSSHATTASSPIETGSSCPEVEGDITWQVSSTLPVRFVEEDQSVSCVVAHDSLSEDVTITLRLDVTAGATGATAGAASATWCLFTATIVLLTSATAQ